MKNIEFKIFWDKIRESMSKNNHYKKIEEYSQLLEESTSELYVTIIEGIIDEEIKYHYRLLRLDEMNKAYLPYMGKEFRWSNQEKEYILIKNEEMKKLHLPNEVKMMINEFRQKNKQG